MYVTSSQVYGSFKRSVLSSGHSRCIGGCNTSEERPVKDAHTSNLTKCRAVADVCVPTPPQPCPRLCPENLPPAGLPSERSICCRNNNSSVDTCQSGHFEPSYCSEPENMKRLVAHEYRQRWYDERQEWARRCVNTSSDACARITNRQCQQEQRFIEKQKLAREYRNAQAEGKTQPDMKTPRPWIPVGKNVTNQRPCKC